MKTGSTGALCFVSVDHTITTPRGTAIRERHDIVYRDTPAAPQAAASPACAAGSKDRESHMADPVLLFRYSALTFNGHRIHYDRDYVTKVEGYPGLIVHGPLQASLHHRVRCKASRRQGAGEVRLSRREAAVRRQRVFRSTATKMTAAWRSGRRIRRVADHEGYGELVGR